MCYTKCKKCLGQVLNIGDCWTKCDKHLGMVFWTFLGPLLVIWKICWLGGSMTPPFWIKGLTVLHSTYLTWHPHHPCSFTQLYSWGYCKPFLPFHTFWKSLVLAGAEQRWASTVMLYEHTMSPPILQSYLPASASFTFMTTRPCSEVSMYLSGLKKYSLLFTTQTGWLMLYLSTVSFRPRGKNFLFQTSLNYKNMNTIGGPRCESCAYFSMVLYFLLFLSFLPTPFPIPSAS